MQMAALFLKVRFMGRETDYRDRTIDDHIDDFEDISVI
jgi:hypothetical protein